METITGVIFFMGVMTVVLSAIVSFKFWGYHKKLKGAGGKLSKAISYQLIGEGVIGLGTLIFATAAHFGYLDSFNEVTKSSIRFTMFFATSSTTYHLLVTLKMIQGATSEETCKKYPEDG